MGIINRDLSASEQRTTYEFYSSAGVATGVTGVICVVPYPASLDAAQIASFGISGSPTVQLVVNRFIPGAGFTTFNIGSANAAVAFGTSGVPVSGASLPIIGSTLTTLLANDVLMYLTGGANSAVTGLGISLVMRPLLDLQKFFGLL